MQNVKSIVYSLYCRACDYNLFMPDENDYGEDDDERDPAIALKFQKYTTRLYLLLLIVYIYILFHATIMNQQTGTVVITNVDMEQFEKLYSKYDEFLSCPCSTITTSYETFISNTIQFHPVCSSFFVSQQWIEALYLLNRSSYEVADFRTTATSQVNGYCVYFQND